ncbi:hypothetical protein, partial [Corynebacterium sp.]|uniref:hypothetical protein n=1 Tax=Corynebacterium sp. TaxID=1720 RepID=UPI002A910C85
MGRHSNGRNNYSLSTGVIAAIVVAALLIAAVVWFGVARPTTSTESTAASCVAGDLEVPVSASDERVARELIDAYAATRPVVRDFCVTPTYSPDIAGAAVHIAPHNPVTHQQIAQAGRSAAEAEPRPVAATTVGLAGSEAASSDVSLSAVAFPVRQQSAASAVVASSLADDEAAAIAALTDQRVDSASDVASDPARFTATAKDAAPEGLVFTALDAAIVYAAIPLNQADPVSEDQARAGQDFARFAADRFNGDASTQPEISEVVWAAATPTGGENLTSDQPVAAAPAASVEDTLFVVDTSDAMAPYFAAVADAIGEAAYAVTDSGQSVALWNYSSPLNPGVA